MKVVKVCRHSVEFGLRTFRASQVSVVDASYGGDF